MHLLIIDGGHVETEFRAKFGPGHTYTFHSTDFDGQEERAAKTQELAALSTTVGAMFSFGYAYHTRPWYNELPLFACPVFKECADASLFETVEAHENGPPAETLFGFCGLPTLLNRPLLEVSLYHETDRAKLAATCAALGTDYRVVADRVGLVTPRVVCQIINEAYYTLQEGTASKADVDLGMKLGTNYPHGPFAWAQAIGVARVYAVLEALWQDTHDERYKVCPLLKREALRG